MMTKAYDLKDLGEKLKAIGLPVAETTAEMCYEAVKAWLKESAVVSATPYDNLVVPFVDQLDQFVKPALDKIDGQPG